MPLHKKRRKENDKPSASNNFSNQGKFADLPATLQLQIFKRLDDKSSAQLKQCSKYFNNLYLENSQSNKSQENISKNNNNAMQIDDTSTSQGNFDIFPDELLLHIFNNLDIQSSACLNQCSSSFYNLLKEKNYWTNKILELYMPRQLLNKFFAHIYKVNPKYNLDLKSLHNNILKVSLYARSNLSVTDLILLTGDRNLLSLIDLDVSYQKLAGYFQLLCLSGNVECINAFLKNIDVNILFNTTDYNSLSHFLDILVRSGNVTLLKTMCEAYPKLLEELQDKALADSLICTSVESGSIAMFKTITAGKSINHLHRRVLLSLTSEGHIDLLKHFVIDENINFKEILPDPKHQFVILKDAACSGNVEFFEYIKNIFNLELTDSQISTLLTVSTSPYLFVPMLEHIFQMMNDRKININNEHITNILKCDCLAAVKFLLTDVMAAQPANVLSNIFHLAAQHCTYDMFKYIYTTLKNKNYIEQINLTGFDVYGNNILHYAVLAGEPELMKFIVENFNIDVNIATTTGLTILELAQDHFDCFKYAIELGAKITVKELMGIIVGYIQAPAEHTLAMINLAIQYFDLAETIKMIERLYLPVQFENNKMMLLQMLNDRMIENDRPAFSNR